MATGTTAAAPLGTRYKWVALSNTTLGALMSALDGSIVIISLPAIFRGIGLDPLAPGNISYLLVSAVLVVTLGRPGDMFGRVRMYNTGFVIFGPEVLAGLAPGDAATLTGTQFFPRLITSRSTTAWSPCSRRPRRWPSSRPSRRSRAGGGTSTTSRTRPDHASVLTTAGSRSSSA